MLATVVVAVGIALADYSRPASRQTHVGRFVGQILHGGAGTEVHRKLDSAIGSVGLTVGTFVVIAAILAGILARERIRRALATSRGVTAGALAVDRACCSRCGSERLRNHDRRDGLDRGGECDLRRGPDRCSGRAHSGRQVWRAGGRH